MEQITDRAHGIDVSHYQEEFILAKTTGQIDFAIAKFSQGYNAPYRYPFVDAGNYDQFMRLWERGVGLLDMRGIYHYFHSGQYSWERQATRLLERLDRISPTPQMVWTDIEWAQNPDLNTEHFISDFWKFQLFLMRNAPSKYRRIGGYWNNDVEQYLFNTGLKYFGTEFTDFLLSLPKWHAQYWFNPSPNKQPGLSKFRSTWDLWQYTMTGDSFVYVNGERWRHYGSPDLNVFNGTPQQMREWLGLVTPPEQPAPIGDGLLHAVLPDGSKYDGAFASFLSVHCGTQPAPTPEPAPEPAPEPDPHVVDVPKYGILKPLRLENGLTLTGRLTPAVRPINDRPVPDGRKGQQIPVTSLTRAYIRSINNEQGAHYANDTKGMMWINSAFEPDDEIRRAESISNQLNFVSWYPEDDENGTHKLLSFQSDEDWNAHDPKKVNWYTRPDLFFKAIATNLTNSVYQNVGAGLDVFIPLMARARSHGGSGALYLAATLIEPFPSLPVEVVTTANVNIREKWGRESAVVGAYLAGEKVTVLQYRPLGASVWGRTSKGWIALLFAPAPGVRQFLTTWRLATPGVIPPVSMPWME